jgi:hypothetical protein
MPSSPEALRQPLASASQSTHDATPEYTPSLRSSSSADGLPMIEGADVYELRSLNNGSHFPSENASLLESPRRFSTSSVQSFELYTPDEDRDVRRKLDKRLVSFMAMLYCLSFLDRSSTEILAYNGMGWNG